METLIYQRLMIDALEDDDDVQNVYPNASDE
ncbi:MULTISPECIES: YebC/PmpR family DNA-binding transcriptional regulator [unclassified Sporosarcina]|nr:MULTISPECIES: YebC/PmpR family DNA-binding transcriptional regulator [unclassified Sporosarcina]